MAEITDEQIKIMRGQANAIGLKVDERWKPETLAVKLADAQEGAISSEQEEYATDPNKIPVKLLKNAFPAQGLKCLRGEVVDIPIAMAKAWIGSGVAERADPLPGE